MKCLGKVVAFLATLAAVASASAYDEAQTVIKLIRATEYKNYSTYYLDGSTRNSRSTHLLELRFKFGLPGTGGGGTIGADLLEATPAGGGGNPPPPNQDYDIVNYSIAFVHIGETGEYPLARTGMTATSNGDLPVVGPYPYALGTPYETAAGLGVGLESGEEVGITVMCDPLNDPVKFLPGGFVNVVVTKSTEHHHWVNNAWQVSHDYAYQRVRYEVEKRATQYVASIDSRRCYGQPNLAGELPSDPNADLRSPAFPGWVYKGGLFVGNMPWTTGDQSATSRIQYDFAAASGPESELRMSTLTTFYMGVAAAATGDVTIGAYMPATGGSSPYTWDNKWPVTPRSTVGNPPDYSQDPLSTLGFNSSTAQGYGNWNLTKITSTTRTSYGLNPYFVLCIAAESSYVNQNGVAWRYFASPAYQAQFPTTAFVGDSAPRIWNVYARYVENWGRVL